MNNLYDDENENVEAVAPKYKHVKSDDLATKKYDSDDSSLDDINFSESIKASKDLHEKTIFNLYEGMKKETSDDLNDDKLEKNTRTRRNSKIHDESDGSTDATSIKKDIDENNDSAVHLNEEKVEEVEDISDNMASFLYDKKEVKNKHEKQNKKMKLWQKILVILICLCISFGSGLAFLLYGPYPNFREWLITTAMTTMNHQYLAKWFYSDKTIESIMKKNYVVESSEEVDTSQVKFVDYSNLKVMYKNKYEKEILTKDKGNNLYKLININDSGMRGYLVVIYDPSKVKIATATNMSSYGEMLTDMVKKNDAIIGMNASGFYDPGYNGNGGKPYGIVIKNGKVVSNLEKPNVGGGIIGFTNDNKLILGKMSANEALNKGVRDGVEFGPYLIVNGKPSFIRGNGGWGTAPRSAIAQRQDGIVLFLVMDGRDYSHGIDGVGMVELTEILMKYGAYNASNLDGGTSSGLVIDGKLINKPVNGSGQKKTRKIPDAWIVIK